MKEDSSALFAVAGLGLIALLWGLWHLYRWKIMPNPSPRALIEESNRCLQSLGVDPAHHRLIDAGCGLGLALRHWKCLGWHRHVGIEGSWLVFSLARALAPIFGLGHREIVRGDWSEKYKELEAVGDVLFFYTCPQAMRESACFLSRYSRKGPLWVVTHTFALPGYTPLKSSIVKGLYHLPVYVYYLE